MFWLLDSCQNSVSADQYRSPVSRARLLTHWVRVFFEVICWQVATFQMIAGSSSIFLKCIWNKSCSGAALLKFWFRTDLGRENSTGFYMQGRQSLLTFLTITRWSRFTSNFYVLIGQNLTGDFMWKIYASSGLLTEEKLSGKTHNNSIAVKISKTVGLIARFRCIILTCTLSGTNCTLSNLRSYFLGQCV